MCYGIPPERCASFTHNCENLHASRKIARWSSEDPLQNINKFILEMNNVNRQVRSSVFPRICDRILKTFGVLHLLRLLKENTHYK